MVNRRDTSSSGDGMGGFLGRLNTALENRIAMLFIASVLGAGGGIGFIKSNPDARADKFTGDMGRALHDELIGYTDVQVHILREELSDHDKSSDKYRHKITANERDIAHLQSEILDLKRLYLDHMRKEQ